MSEPTAPDPATARRWRYYRTTGGACPVREFLDGLAPREAQVVRLSMALVRRESTLAARHLRDDLYEVRVGVGGRAYRVIFAMEGSRSQVLLGLEAFEKKTQATPGRILNLAEQRLSDWRARGQRQRGGGMGQ